MAQSLLTQIVNGGNIVLQISSDDLREVMKSFYHEEKERTEQAIQKNRERPTISRREACELLGVSLATLWKWGKSGFLVPVKIGTKVMYKATDIDEILKTERGGAA